MSCCRSSQAVLSILLLTLLMPIGQASATAETIELTNGETLSGRIVERNEEHLLLAHPLLGEVTIPVDHVAAVRPSEPPAPPSDAETAGQVEQDEQAERAEGEAVPRDDADWEADQDAEDPAAEVPPVTLDAPEPSFFDDWDLTLSLGFSGAEGNADNRSFNGQFKAFKETEQDRWLFENKYFYGTNAGDTTQNEFSTELIKDWLEPDSPWFYFARGSYEYDEFKSWDHRLSGFGGVGYTFVENDDFEFIGRAGAGLTQEMGGPSGDRLTPEALFGASVLRWHITEQQNLTASTTLYPALDDIGQYRVTSTVEWVVDLEQGDGLKLKFGLENEYESQTEGDAKHNDLKYYGALVYDF